VDLSYHCACPLLSSLVRCQEKTDFFSNKIMVQLWVAEGRMPRFTYLRG
jgi:hypothetical protein